MGPRRHRGQAALALAVLALVVLGLAHSAEIRARAEVALGSGVPAREAALARGFVLGEDEEVDAATREDFRRAGLSHLLAVSGQNVALLALLAMPVLAAFGIPLRARLVWVLGLIAVYVPLAGAGPSIQRAAVMGALGVLATLAGRRSSRLYGLAVAAVVTLAIEPSVAADVGWQLSFAAVVGILALAGPIREAIAERLGRGTIGRMLAEGAALTVAATLATAPLIAFHFGEASLVTLLANLLALPAVAPAMWLGMLIAAAGQVPGVPLGVLGPLESALLAYIAAVAGWCARPGWASVSVQLGPLGLALSYAALATLALCARRLGRVLASAATATLLALAAALLFTGLGGGDPRPPPATGLRVSVLDVGQGDSILLQPAAAPPILVDGGPFGDDLASSLRRAGVRQLGAVVVTHDEADHVGGVIELLGSMPIGRLLYGRLDRSTIARARAAGALTRRLAAGSEIRSGSLRLDLIWPPRELLAEAPGGEDPNLLALVMVARWRRFSILLTADAEAEAVPIDPGPVDVLKVAHHGSDDAGLGALLERTSPRLALISVGADNTYGHPTRPTLATLAAHGVLVLRTDRDGTVVLEVSRGGVAIGGG